MKIGNTDFNVAALKEMGFDNFCALYSDKTEAWHKSIWEQLGLTIPEKPKEKKPQKE